MILILMLDISSAATDSDSSDTLVITVYGIKFCAIKNSILSLIVETRGVITVIFQPTSLSLCDGDVAMVNEAS